MSYMSGVIGQSHARDLDHLNQIHICVFRDPANMSMDNTWPKYHLMIQGPVLSSWKDTSSY